MSMSVMNQARHADLHDAVEELEPRQADRNGFDEEPEVPG